MKTEISLVIVRTGSEKAMISQGSNTGQEEEKVWPGRAILSFTWLKSQQYPNGIKVQMILSQATVPAKGGENQTPQQQAGLHSYSSQSVYLSIHGSAPAHSQG